MKSGHDGYRPGAGNLSKVDKAAKKAATDAEKEANGNRLKAMLGQTGGPRAFTENTATTVDSPMGSEEAAPGLESKPTPPISTSDPSSAVGRSPDRLPRISNVREGILASEATVEGSAGAEEQTAHPLEDLLKTLGEGPFEPDPTDKVYSTAGLDDSIPSPDGLEEDDEDEDDEGGICLPPPANATKEEERAGPTVQQ